MATETVPPMISMALPISKPANPNLFELLFIMVVFTSLCASALKFALTLQVEEQQALALVHRIQLCWGFVAPDLADALRKHKRQSNQNVHRQSSWVIACPTASTRNW